MCFTDSINSLVNHTKIVFEANNINPNKLDNVTTFEEYKTIIDSVFGWNSDQTVFLLDGFFRRDEREIDKIK
jgi:hypothetical protein